MTRAEIIAQLLTVAIMMIGAFVFALIWNGDGGEMK